MCDSDAARKLTPDELADLIGLLRGPYTVRRILARELVVRIEPAPCICGHSAVEDNAAEGKVRAYLVEMKMEPRELFRLAYRHKFEREMPPEALRTDVAEYLRVAAIPKYVAEFV